MSSHLQIQGFKGVNQNETERKLHSFPVESQESYWPPAKNHLGNHILDVVPGAARAGGSKLGADS
jgi:hypothetical protein